MASLTPNRLIFALTGLLTLAACATPPPLPTLVPTLPAPNVTAPPSPVTETTPTAGPSPSPTPVPIELVICQKNEPLSLYLYSDNVAARLGIFEALFDGPIDAVNFGYQPVILEALPSLENGGLKVNSVTVKPGDKVVDAVSWKLKVLEPGVTLAQADGSRSVYTGTAPAQTIQIVAEFKLKAGLLWSDGQQLTADDSRFSFELASFYDTESSKFVTDRTLSYEVIDPLTVRWTGLPGWLDNEAETHFWTPFPRHVYGDVNPLELKSNETAARQPLGWGPFMLQEWKRGDRLALARNPNYYRAAEGLPKVDRVVFRFGLSPEQIIEDMKAGRCHIGAEEADFTGHVPLLREAQAAGQISPQFVASPTFEHLDFGIQPTVEYKRLAGEDLFQDVHVRQAVAYCLDRQALIDQLQGGIGEVPAAYLPNPHPLYAADRVTNYPFDPARGGALLEEAGWTRAGGGVRQRGSQKFSVDFASGSEGNAFRELLARLIQEQLRSNCGINLNLKWYAPQDLYDPWPNGPLFGRKFDLGAFPWRAGAEPPCDLYLTEAIPTDQNPGGANNTGYSNPGFDSACQRALSSFDDAARRAAHAEAQAIFTRDLPSLPLFFRFKVGLARPDVGGYQLDSTARSDVWNIEQISLPKP
jgi:peptide/nickel transport system substrate-binding protein